VRRFLRHDIGQSAVELALVLPILLTLLIGIVDVALLLNADATVTNASREATTYAITHPTGAPSAITSAATSRSAPLLPAEMSVASTYYDSASATFVPWPAGGLPSHNPVAQVPVSVEVSYPWKASTILIGQFFGGTTRSVTARSTMVVTW
jgi:Flp pilus assembly protein TadG